MDAEIITRIHNAQTMEELQALIKESRAKLPAITDARRARAYWSAVGGAIDLRRMYLQDLRGEYLKRKSPGERRAAKVGRPEKKRLPRRIAVSGVSIYQRGKRPESDHG